MSRVKRGVTAHARHKKILALAKGYRGRRKNVYRIAKQAVMRAGQYGSLTLNLDGNVLKESFLGRVDGVRVRTAAGPARMRVCRTFAEAIEDEAVLYTDSSGSLAMAVNHGSAAERLGLVPDDEIKLAPMP